MGTVRGGDKILQCTGHPRSQTKGSPAQNVSSAEVEDLCYSHSLQWALSSAARVTFTL